MVGGKLGNLYSGAAWRQAWPLRQEPCSQQ